MAPITKEEIMPRLIVFLDIDQIKFHENSFSTVPESYVVKGAHYFMILSECNFSDDMWYVAPLYSRPANESADNPDVRHKLLDNLKCGTFEHFRDNNSYISESQCLAISADAIVDLSHRNGSMKGDRSYYNIGDMNDILSFYPIGDFGMWHCLGRSGASANV